jgi:tetratricopeptide (TPR) repeat protein
MHKSLGWCLLAEGKTDEARQEFEHALDELKEDNGTYDLDAADPDEMVAAYFLDLVNEEKFASHKSGDARLACFPWFYIAQRREIEGKHDAAIAAYERCLESGADDKAHAVRALAQWRLTKMRVANESGQK